LSQVKGKAPAPVAKPLILADPSRPVAPAAGAARLPLP
jgi:hypothetical protein